MDKNEILGTIVVNIVRFQYNDDIEEAEKHEEEIEQQIALIQKFLDDQINIYESIKESNIINQELKIDSETGNVIFEEGTLIHGASKCGYDKLISYREKGIMSGDFIGISEAFNDESYLCADFYRAEKRIQATEFFERIAKSDILRERLPFGTTFGNAECIAFIINPNPQLQELLDTDMYKEENDKHIMQLILNLLYKDKSEYECRKKISAIPYGIPANAISGIVVGDYLLHREEYMQVLQQIFPDCYILNYAGKVFFDPNLSKEENMRKKEECLEQKRKFHEYLLERGDADIEAFLRRVPKDMFPSLFSEEEIKNATTGVLQSNDTQLAEQRKKDLLIQRKINTPAMLEASEQTVQDQRTMEQENEGHNNYGE